MNPVYPALLVSGDGSVMVLENSGVWPNTHDLWFWSEPEHFLVDQQCRRFEQAGERDEDGHPSEPPAWIYVRFVQGPEMTDIALRHLAIEQHDPASLQAELELAGPDLEATTALDYLLRVERAPDPGIPAIDSFPQAKAQTAYLKVIRYGVPLAIGFLVELIASGSAGAAGLMKIIVLPFISAVVATIFLAISIYAGRMLQKTLFLRRWNANLFPATLTLLVGLVLCTFGIFRQMRPVDIYDPESSGLGGAYWIGYLLLMFSLTNFPYAHFFKSFRLK